MEVGSIQKIEYTGKYSLSEKPDGSEKEKNTSGFRNNDDLSQIKNGSILASELNIAGDKDTGLKELLAKREALKKQLEQFEKDADISDNIKSLAESRELLQKEAIAGNKEVENLNNLKKILQKDCGVSDDSEEQKNLKLMEKQLKGKEPLSEEELLQLENMGPLTDYQKAALDYDEMIQVWDERTLDAANKSTCINKAIIGIKLELLKSNPMLEAKQEAENILKKADEDIQKVLLNKIKEKINEKLDIDPNDQILINPEDLIQKKKATEEDLKGLAVDEKI